MRRVFHRWAGWVLLLLLPLDAHAAPAGIGFLNLNPTVPIPALPVTPEKNAPVVISAREMGYDEKNQIVVAIGNVEVLQGAEVLTTDRLTYYQARNLVIAEGNVVQLKPTGDVFFADKVELRDNLKQGVILDFKARFADDSLLVAERATKVSPAITQLDNASYTPCNICADVAPFWQLNASEVTLNDLRERVEYSDVNLEFFGVPILYSPVLSHPSPDANAKSGFLSPSYGTNSNIGTFAQVPFYWRIAENQEAVITPWFTTDVGTVLNLQYDYLGDDSSYTVNASGTNPSRLDAEGNEISGNEFRGHIFANGSKNLSTYSRVGFNISRATDDTYLRRYGFAANRSLFSRAFYETAEGRSFGLAEGIAIQGLQLDDSSTRTPVILPSLRGYYETPADANGIRYHIAGDIQALTREVGADQRRLSTTLGATLPYVSTGGHVFTSTLNLRQDIYNSNDVTLSNGDIVDSTNLRTLPQAALEWRYPLIRQFSGGTMTIAPILLAVAQLDTGNPQGISNEDNQLISLTDTNLFSINRMPGLDTVDSGSRLAYGFRSQYLFHDGRSPEFLFGQNYNANDETPFPNSTTPGENFSDYIGRVGFAIAPVNLAYRFALDQDTLVPTRNELTLGYSRPWLTIQTAYRSIDDNQFLTASEEAQIDFAAPLTEQRSMYGGARRDLERSQMVTANGGIIFRNECFNFVLDALRTFARDRDLEPNTQFTFRIGLKNLGEFGGN